MVKGALVWVSLDPARGAEIPKTRPCVIVSRTEANDVSSTVTVVPLSSVTGRAEYVQVLYAFHFDSLPKNGHEHEHGSYHVPWNSRNVEMNLTVTDPAQAAAGALRS